jgi:hypothetical protein
VFSISAETRAGVAVHHRENAIDALVLVEGIQRATQLPVTITNRATGRALTVEELRHLANLERAERPGAR